MALIFIFVDGIGLGEDNSKNPFVTSEYPSFEKMTRGQRFTQNAQPHTGNNILFKQLDACLGVQGLPQSGTGQVTLFTGINAADKIGKHFGPYPHSAIREYLGGDSIFSAIKREKGSCYFMNAYPEIYFEYAKNKNRWSCTTLMTRKAGMPLNSVKEVLDEKAITAEITQKVWKTRLSLDVPEITEEQAADRVVSMSGKYDLVLMEYYLTDKAGHSKDFEQAKDVLSRLDKFLQRLFTESLKFGHTLLLTSDHGNLEDLSTKTHTTNNVPLYVQGPGADSFSSAKSIQDIKPLCLEWFRSTFRQGG